MQTEPAKRHLFVILGAGASYNCASKDVRENAWFPVDRRLQPPLVSDLFSPRFADVLDQYPRVAQIAPSIRVALRSGGVGGLEDYLEDELRNSQHRHLREAYWGIPLYLQHLLLKVSTGYTTEPDNYDRLISAVLRLDRVTFITLNYDLILDTRLAIQAGRPPDSLDWYIDNSRNWALIKIHGSVNWRKEVLNAPDIPRPDNDTQDVHFAALGDDLALSPGITLVPAGGIGTFRTSGPSNKKLYFPALAVPVRTKEEGEWYPHTHNEAIWDHMRRCFDGFNILVIGYQAVDDDVLSLFREAGRPLRSLVVVDRGKQGARTVVNRFFEGIPNHARVDQERAAFDGDFESFAQSTALEEFVATI